jgi:hypothetical protein
VDKEWEGTGYKENAGSKQQATSRQGMRISTRKMRVQGRQATKLSESGFSGLGDLQD